METNQSIGLLIKDIGRSINYLITVGVYISLSVAVNVFVLIYIELKAVGFVSVYVNVLGQILYHYM